MHSSSFAGSFGDSGHMVGMSSFSKQRTESLTKMSRKFASPKRKLSILERQLIYVKKVEDSKVPYDTFFDNNSDSDSSGEGRDLSPKQKHKYIRLMNQNYQVTQLQLMNDYVTGLEQKKQTLNEMVEASNVQAQPKRQPQSRLSKVAVNKSPQPSQPAQQQEVAE